MRDREATWDKCSEESEASKAKLPTELESKQDEAKARNSGEEPIFVLA
jgi:hypothetical protein